jgi:hypothetical protein
LAVTPFLVSSEKQKQKIFIFNKNKNLPEIVSLGERFVEL